MKVGTTWLVMFVIAAVALCSAVASAIRGSLSGFFFRRPACLRLLAFSRPLSFCKRGIRSLPSKLNPSSIDARARCSGYALFLVLLR